MATVKHTVTAGSLVSAMVLLSREIGDPAPPLAVESQLGPQAVADLVVELLGELLEVLVVRFSTGRRRASAALADPLDGRSIDAALDGRIGRCGEHDRSVLGAAGDSRGDGRRARVAAARPVGGRGGRGIRAVGGEDGRLGRPGDGLESPAAGAALGRERATVEALL